MTEFRVNLYNKVKIGFAERGVYFALHYLRYIIVLTQIVVISVFFARFKLDQDIVDLRESVSQKQEILEVTLPIVDDARDVATRIDYVQDFLQGQNDFQDKLNTILLRVPITAIINKLEIDESSVSVEGVAKDVLSIKYFFSQIRENEVFKDAVIKDVTKNSDLSFSYKFEIPL